MKSLIATLLLVYTVSVVSAQNNQQVQPPAKPVTAEVQTKPQQQMQTNVAKAPTAEAQNNAPIRFSVAYSKPEAAKELSLKTNYNTNMVSVSVGDTMITIYKTGLYQVDGVVGVSLQYPVNAPPRQPPYFNFDLKVNATTYPILIREPVPSAFANNNGYSQTENYSLNLYIVAPARIVLKQTIMGESGRLREEVKGWINIYRIGD